MKFFIDFEANARTNEIISIGIKNEAGEGFSTLVRPTTKVDRKITELTGITQEAVEEAPGIEGAVHSLVCWLQQVDDKQSSNRFYCYGSSDKDFIKASMAVAETVFVKQVLDYIMHHLHNIAPEVSKRFNRTSISLRSAYLTMRMETEDSLPATHEALCDAEMLRYVYQHFQNYTLPEGVEPVKISRVNMCYGKPKPALEEKYHVAIKVTQDTKARGHREWTFPNVAAAMSIIPRLNKNTNKRKVMDKILEAAETNGSYAGKNFSLA